MKFNWTGKCKYCGAEIEMNSSAGIKAMHENKLVCPVCRPEHRKKSKTKYADANRQKLNAKNKKWRAENPDKNKKAISSWYGKHPGYQSERNKAPNEVKRRHVLDKARNDKLRAVAKNFREPWTDEMDRFILENKATMTEVELAKKSGRSMKAIEARLWRLRKGIV